MNDISKYYKRPTYASSKMAEKIVELEGTPQAVIYFSEHAETLDDYSYWYFLSTLWVSYTGWTDLNLWKKLFESNRPKRKHCIMKPSELKRLDYLPNKVKIYRAHRKDETDWIAYTLSESVVKRFAKERNVLSYSVYTVNRKDILALFTRRGEEEIIVLDKDKVTFVETLFLDGVIL